jgi:hypothetical protein
MNDERAAIVAAQFGEEGQSDIVHAVDRILVEDGAIDDALGLLGCGHCEMMETGLLTILDGMECDMGVEERDNLMDM